VGPGFESLKVHHNRAIKKMPKQKPRFIRGFCLFWGKKCPFLW